MRASTMIKFGPVMSAIILNPAIVPLSLSQDLKKLTSILILTDGPNHQNHEVLISQYYKLSLTDTELECMITNILLKDIIFNQDSLLYLKCYWQLQQSSFFWNDSTRTRGFINKKQRIVN